MLKSLLLPLSAAQALVGGARSPVARPLGASTAAMPLVDPAYRERQGNLAQYLVDLHDRDAVFDFCGGMMFQLRLSAALRARLVAAAAGDGAPVVLHDASVDRMAKTPGYERSAAADGAALFHGREVRRVPGAAGGHGFVLQLVDAGGADPEGWSPPEVAGYDGWGHDAGRTWRDGARLEREGVAGFRAAFGPDAFTLNHRFYFHVDRANQLWLSAEDGCEGRLHAASE